ncbi:hypothetical protein EMCRGX_G002107 [Ephydatia muelleri]
MQTARSIVSGGEPSDLMEKEVLTLSDEERKSLLQKAGITNVAIDSAQVLAIKAGLAIPWNKMRLLRRHQGVRDNDCKETREGTCDPELYNGG